MLKNNLRLIFIATFILSAAFTCKSQVTVTQAKDLAESSQCVTSGSLSKPKFLRSTRNEEFEDFIFSLQKKNYEKLAKAAFIFKVEETGIFITDSNEIINVTSTGFSPKFIAVLMESGKVLGLFGCRNSKDNFQTLMKDAKIMLTSVSDAVSFGYLYYRLVEDPNLSRIIYKPRDFRHEIENYFFDQFPKNIAKSRFRKWKESFRKFKGQAKLGLTATKQIDEYSISVTFFSQNLNEIPNLQNDIILVNTDGEIKLHRTTNLFK